MRYFFVFAALLLAGCRFEASFKPQAAQSEYNISEPLYHEQWYLDYNQTFYEQNGINENAHINFESAAASYSGKGVVIAIIDFGFDATHEEFENAAMQTKNVIENSEDVKYEYSSDNHGTAVSGIIAAQKNNKGIQGIAPDSELIFIKMPEVVSDSEVIELFDEAEALGADIISCSWGTYEASDALKEKIIDMATNGRDKKGIVVVFAAGNDDKPMGNDESAMDGVIAVGSSDEDNLRAFYSNFGENLDILAPGGDLLGITTLDNQGEDGQSNSLEYLDYMLFDDENSFGGTSAAAPMVSGAIALLLEANPNLTRTQIEEILQNSSDKIGNNIYIEGRNDYYGYGKLNLKKALEEVLRY